MKIFLHSPLETEKRTTKVPVRIAGNPAEIRNTDFRIQAFSIRPTATIGGSVKMIEFGVP
jgi:hypothetical protein